MSEKISIIVLHFGYAESSANGILMFKTKDINGSKYKEFSSKLEAFSSLAKELYLIFKNKHLRIKEIKFRSNQEICDYDFNFVDYIYSLREIMTQDSVEFNSDSEYSDQDYNEIWDLCVKVSDLFDRGKESVLVVSEHAGEALVQALNADVFDEDLDAWKEFSEDWMTGNDWLLNLINTGTGYQI